MQNGDTELALSYFEKTRKAYEIMKHSIDSLVTYLRSHGNTKESITEALMDGIKNS